MTVQTNTNSIAYVGNGSTVHFDYNFLILDASHLKVYFGDVLQTSGYVVSGVLSQTGGTVAFSSAPAAGVKITLTRNVPFFQLVDYQPYDAFPAESHERALDLLTMMAQQLEDKLDRAMQLPVGGDKWDARGNEIINVAAGGSDTSAPNVGQVKSLIALYAGPDSAAQLRADLAATGGAAIVGTSSGRTVQQELDEISVVDYAKYQRATKIANILRDAPVAFTISLFGDSTMWGSIPFNTTSQDPKHPGVALKQALDLIYPGNSVTVVNAARPGTTLKQLLNGTDGGSGTYADRLLASPSTTIVFCNHCLNDCGSYESTLSQYRDNLVVWVNTTRAYGKIPVLVTPSLISPIEDGREDQMKRQPAFIQAMRDVAATMSVDLVDNFKFTEASAELYKPQDIAPDGVHLSQLFYQQAGWNMAIPLINPHVIRDVGDVAGLSTSAWADNITEARAIWDTHPNRFSAILTGDAIATTQAVNFPVVVAKPTKDTVLAVGCALTGAGGRGQLTYFGFEGQPQFNGVIDYKAGANSDFDCLCQPTMCALPAGLSIVGVKINTAISPAPNVNFTFAGVQLIKRVESGFGYPNDSGYQLNREILVRDELLTHQYLASGVVLFELRQAVSPFDTLAKLHWNGATGKVELTTVSGTTVVVDTPQPGPQNASLFLNDDRTVTAKVGGLTATSAPATSSIGRAFVASATPYWLKKY